MRKGEKGEKEKRRKMKGETGYTFKISSFYLLKLLNQRSSQNSEKYEKKKGPKAKSPLFLLSMAFNHWHRCKFTNCSEIAYKYDFVFVIESLLCRQ